MCVNISMNLFRKEFSIVQKRKKKNEFSELGFICAVFVYLFALNLSLIFFINVYFFYKCLFT